MEVEQIGTINQHADFVQSCAGQGSFFASSGVCTWHKSDQHYLQRIEIVPDNMLLCNGGLVLTNAMPEDCIFVT